MTNRRRKPEQHISNLSFGFIESAFVLLAQEALPTYKKNMELSRPPVAARENINSAISIILLMTGLDYHLCRLKYLRDVAPHNPPLPNTPYFKWNFTTVLKTKLKQLLIQRKEQRLLRQLMELSLCRNAIIHARLYTITERYGLTGDTKGLVAELKPHPEDYIQNLNATLDLKKKKNEVSKSLGIPFVPTWISYVDAVICVLVLHRFLNLLERKYGNPYAWVGGITAYKKETKDLFMKWNWEKSFPMDLEDWVKAFWESLSTKDQDRVRRAIGGNVSDYIQKPLMRSKIPQGSLKTLAELFDISKKSPPRPKFLYSPPP